MTVALARHAFVFAALAAWAAPATAEGTGTDIKVGVLTALIGVPVFLFLLSRQPK